MGLLCAQSEMADRASRDDIGKTIDYRYRIGYIPGTFLALKF
jgi:hypothetical protein